MAHPPPTPRIQPWSLWLIAAFLLGGVLVSINYIKRNKAEALSPRPPYSGKLERDFSGQNRDGTTVRLSSLKGQIWVTGCLYTDSPSQASAVARHLKSIWDEFGGDPRFHLVLFSVNPAGDTPEKRNAFLGAHGLDDPRCWFLTSDPTELSRYAIRYLRMMPTRPVTDPGRQRDWGPFEYDVRLALIDGKANLRGQYQLLHPQSSAFHLARLRQDLHYLLDEKPENP